MRIERDEYSRADDEMMNRCGERWEAKQTMKGQRVAMRGDTQNRINNEGEKNMNTEKKRNFTCRGARERLHSLQQRNDIMRTLP